MMQRERWTQTHISDLRIGLRGGETVETIATALGRTPDDLRAMMNRLRLKAQPLFVADRG
jgi:hypothetical protein